MRTNTTMRLLGLSLLVACWAGPCQGMILQLVIPAGQGAYKLQGVERPTAELVKALKYLGDLGSEMQLFIICEPGVTVAQLAECMHLVRQSKLHDIVITTPGSVGEVKGRFLITADITRKPVRFCTTAKEEDFQPDLPKAKPAAPPAVELSPLPAPAATKPGTPDRPPTGAPPGK